MSTRFEEITMVRYAKLASFRTQQRSLRRTEPEDERLTDAAKKVEATRTTERSPDAERLKADLDARTESVKAAAKEGSADELLSKTADRALIEEARVKADGMEPEDRVEVELAVARTTDADLRGTATKLGQTTDPEKISELEAMSRTAAADLKVSTTAVRDIAPATSLPPEVATATEVSEASAGTITDQVSDLATMESMPVMTGGGLPAGATGAGLTEASGPGDADGPPVLASVEFDPDLFDVGTTGGEGDDASDDSTVLLDFIERADARADAFRDAEQEAMSEVQLAHADVVSSGATIDAHMANLELLSAEGGAPGLGGVDVDYVLNDHAIAAVLTGISDEAQANVDHQVAIERTKLAELRAEVSRDFSDGVSDAFDDSALGDGPGVDAPEPALAPYADQVDAFAARAQVAAAEFEELTSMRDAFAGFGLELGHDITVLESRLAAAEASYASNQTLSLEMTAPPSGLTIDVFDYRLDQGAFDGAVDSLRDLSSIQAELAAKRAVLADVRAEVELLGQQVEDAEEDLERAEARLDAAEELLDEAIEAAAQGEDPPDLDPAAVARADLEELRDDIADLEEQLDDVEDDARDADYEADMAEGTAVGSSAIADSLADVDFGLPHSEIEFQLIPAPPGYVTVAQVDMGVNDPALRSALDAVERDLESRAEATQARAEADLAERRHDEMEAMLEELQAAEAELADEVPPLPEPADSGDADDVDQPDEPAPDDGSPQVTDLDPDANLDLTVDGGSTDTGTFLDVDAVEPVAEVEPIPDPADAPVAQAEPSIDDLDLEFGGGSAATDEVITAENAPQVEADLEPTLDPAEVPSETPVMAATDDLEIASDLVAADTPVQADVELADTGPSEPTEVLTRDLTAVEPLEAAGPGPEDLELD